MLSFDIMKFITGSSEKHKFKKLEEIEIEEVVDKATELYMHGQSALWDLGLVNWWDPTSVLRIAFEWFHLQLQFPMWASIMIVCSISEMLIFSYGVVLNKKGLSARNRFLAYSHKILNQGSYYFYIFAFARMNYADYPGLQSGGWLWFKDLTQYDPYFLLPAISAVIIFSTYYNSKPQFESFESERFKYRQMDRYRGMDTQVWEWTYFRLCIAISSIYFGIGLGVSAGSDLCILSAIIATFAINYAKGDYNHLLFKKTIAKESSLEYKRNQEKLMQELIQKQRDVPGQVSKPMKKSQ
uniref:Uncharacterized protein n=1 Tax=Acrobeloides nanus TaxID=290746 RepID=A0A914E201_9BILA